MSHKKCKPLRNPDDEHSHTHHVDADIVTGYHVGAELVSSDLEKPPRENIHPDSAEIKQFDFVYNRELERLHHSTYYDYYFYLSVKPPLVVDEIEWHMCGEERVRCDADGVDESKQLATFELHGPKSLGGKETGKEGETKHSFRIKLANIIWKFPSFELKKKHDKIDEAYRRYFIVFTVHIVGKPDQVIIEPFTLFAMNLVYRRDTWNIQNGRTNASVKRQGICCLKFPLDLDEDKKDAFSMELIIPYEYYVAGQKIPYMVKFTNQYDLPINPTVHVTTYRKVLLTSLHAKRNQGEHDFNYEIEEPVWSEEVNFSRLTNDAYDNFALAGDRQSPPTFGKKGEEDNCMITHSYYIKASCFVRHIGKVEVELPYYLCILPLFWQNEDEGTLEIRYDRHSRLVNPPARMVPYDRNISNIGEQFETVDPHQLDESDDKDKIPIPLYHKSKEPGFQPVHLLYEWRPRT
eukprot:GHVU01075662.1.p1 GENE.GHVU01075662.1~~GHVU01075662.1.p1  ORF type:complete len:463 (+),score=48.27 GHVU01075662.1:403-1791(+)